MSRALVATVVLSLLGCTPATPPREVDLLIAGGRVIDPSTDAPPALQDVAIDDGRIVAVEPELAGRFEAATTLDVAGRWLIPGLADMHSHFGNGILPPEEDDTTQVLARHLYYGNTTILNLGSFQAWPKRIDDLRARMKAGDLEGPRLLAVGALITRVGSHPTTTIYSPEVQARIAEVVASAPPEGPIDLVPLRATTLVRTPEDVAQEVRRVAEWGADAIKITVEPGPSEFGSHPRMTPEMIAAAFGAARPLGLKVLCHVSALPELEDCLAQGASGAVHGVTPQEDLPEDLETRMRDAGFILIPTGAMFDGWIRYVADPGLLDDSFLAETLSEREHAWLSSPGMLERMNPSSFVEPVRRLRDHLRRLQEVGGTIVAGTDTGNPYRFAGYALHEELAFYVSAGLTEREALATATVNAARLVGEESRWGAIREGLGADLVVLEKSPLESIENTRSIVEVIRGGRRVDRAALPVR